MKKMLLSLFVICLFITILAVIGIQHANASISSKVEQNMSSIIEHVNELVTTDPKAAMSSNPYTYIANNQNYKNLVNLGYDAIPVLVEDINKSGENGLREYILAIAIEEIAKVDLKKNRSEWSTAKDFINVWKIHLKNLTLNVNSIADSNEPNDRKVQELVLLGTPAIPFIMDKIEQGNTGIFPALEQLLNGSSISLEQPISDKVEWVKQHKSEFDDLRELVNKESQ